MHEGKLTRLWVRASASLPLGWHLAGVMRREIATQLVPAGSTTGEDEWVALALEADGPGSATGTGTSSEQALGSLAEQLRQMGAVRTDRADFRILVLYIRRQLDA